MGKKNANPLVLIIWEKRKKNGLKTDKHNFWPSANLDVGKKR